jgi:hypothetical protein
MLSDDSDGVMVSWCPWVRHRWLPWGVGTQQSEIGELRTFLVFRRPGSRREVLVGRWDGSLAEVARKRLEDQLL